MRHTMVVVVAVGVWAATVPEFPNAAVAGRASQTGTHKTMITIPPSLQAEHKAIHNALTAATKAPGRVGAAARELAAVLGPHFKREDEIALPALGLLAPLAAGEKPAGMEEALLMSDAVRKELPHMLELARASKALSHGQPYGST